MYEEAQLASPNKLATHISWTYFSLRTVMFLLAVFFPISLWVWSIWHFEHWEPGPSISGYYHAETDWIRDHFVGTLSAVGICLIAYYGLTNWENWLLNLAGAALIGVAMFPTGIDQAPRRILGEAASSTAPAEPAPMITTHGVCAVTFFLCIALVALTQAKHSLKLIEDEAMRSRFSRFYNTLGLLMVLLPAAAWCILQYTERHWGIFAVESLGVFVFAAYWLTKTLEFRGTNGEPEAILLGI